MSELNNIVQVIITKSTKSIARASFGVPAIIDQFLTSKTPTTPFTRARYYGSLAEMSADGWAAPTYNPTTGALLTGDRIYGAAAAIFSQNPSVTKIMVGRKDAADATYAAALDAISLETTNWYAFTVVTDAITDVDMQAIAAWTQTQVKLYFIQSADADIFDATSGNDIAGILKGLSYDRTATIYHTALKASEYANMAWVGNCLPFDAGSQTWAFKTLAGVTPDSLTVAQENFCIANNVNYYTTTAGVGITQDGKVASGEYIDIMIGVDWIKARLSENVYSLFVNNRKVPYDDTGIQMVVGIVNSTLAEAVNMGILQAGSIVVSAPKYSEISSTDKLSRTLPNVNFTALLQGAIHKVKINGVLSL